MSNPKSSPKRRKRFSVPALIGGRPVISRQATASKCGKHVATTYRMQATDPDFPKPIQLSPNRVGFYEDEVDSWLAKRPRIQPPVYVDSRPGRQRIASQPRQREHQSAARPRT